MIRLYSPDKVVERPIFLSGVETVEDKHFYHGIARMTAQLLVILRSPL